MNASPNQHERRRYRRFPMIAHVRLYSGTTMWTTELIDVSLRGALVLRPEAWDGQPDALFRLDMKLENGPIIGMGVKLVRNGTQELGFACQKIDLDSFSRLKRMIELNLGNTELLNRELAMLGLPD